MQNLRNLFIDTAKMYSSHILSILLSLVATVLVARILGADGRGVYTWIFTVVGIGTYLTSMGLETVNRKFASEDPSLTPMLCWNSLFAFGLSFFITALIFIGLMFTEIGDAYTWALLLGLLSIPFSMLTANLSSILTAHGCITFVSLLSIINKLLASCFILSLIFFDQASLIFVCLASTVANGFIAAFTVYSLKEFIFKVYSPSLSFFLNEYGYAVIAAVTTFCYFLTSKFDLFYLGFHVSLSELGNYGIARSLFDMGLILPTTIGYLIVSELPKYKNIHDKVNLVNKILLILIGLGLAGVVMIYTLSPFIIPALFGTEFISSVQMLTYLSLSLVPSMVYIFIMNVLIMIASKRQAIFIPVIMLLINITVNVLFIPVYGIHASILSYLCSSIIGMLMCLVFYKKTISLLK